MKHILFNENDDEVRVACGLLTKEGVKVTIAEKTLSEGFLEYANGDFDLFISGKTHPTKDVLRAAFQAMPVKGDRKKVGSYMVLEGLSGELYFFADCAVNPDPTVEELAHTAADAAEGFRALAKKKPRVAFISYSTHGSGQGESVEKVRAAYELFARRHPAVFADGELQMDAALNPSVYENKTGKVLEKPFTVFIFPNLDTANAAYKLAVAWGRMKAYGPFVIGLERLVLDLSRSATAEEIAKTAIMGLALTGE